MTISKLKHWLITKNQTDQWWVAVDGEVQDGILDSQTVAKLKDECPMAKISILHISLSDDENAEWSVFEKEGPTPFKLAPPVGQSLKKFRKIPPVKSGSTQPAGPAEPAPQETTTHTTKSARAAADPEDSEGMLSADTTTVEKQNNESAHDRAKKFFERRLKKDPIAAPSSPAKASNQEVEALRTEVAQLREEVIDLKDQLRHFRDHIDDLTAPIAEAKAMLEERDQFLEMSENALFEKAQRQEIIATEMAQKKDELDRREKRLVNREKALNTA